MIRQIRFVTRHPAPEFFIEFEPLARRGTQANAYTFAERSDLSARQLDTLYKLVDRCYREHIPIGLVDLKLRTKALVFSLQQNGLNAAEMPSDFFPFAHFCNLLKVPVFCMARVDKPYVCQVFNEKSLTEAAERRVSKDNWKNGQDPQLAQQEHRLAWLEKLCQDLRINLADLGLVTNRPEDLPIFGKVGFAASLAFTPPPTAQYAFSPNADCHFLALLLFGRDILTTRGAS